MLNILLFKLGLQSVIHEIKLLPVLSVISTAIIGPIIEEFVFRGIIYNKLKESFTIISSIVLVSLLFGIFHLNLIQGIYAFMLSIVVSICYEKSHNLYVPILIHCFANITTSLLLPFILVLKFIYIDIFFIMFLIIGIFCIFKLKRNMND